VREAPGVPSAPNASLWKSRTGSVRPLRVLRSRSSTSVLSSPGGPGPGTKNSLAHSVYDRHQYADENKRVMEATAAKIMALVEGRPGTGAKVVRLPSGAIA
jgi:hypothetical protein